MSHYRQFTSIHDNVNFFVEKIPTIGILLLEDRTGADNRRRKMKKNPNKKIKTSVSFSPEHLEAIDRLKIQERRSRSFLLDEIIKEGIASIIAEGADNFGEGMKYFRHNLKHYAKKGAKSLQEKSQALKRRAAKPADDSHGGQA